MSYSVVGKCSLCGGKVYVPNVWLGIFPPDETCSSCGALSDRLPEIKMKPVDGLSVPHIKIKKVERQVIK